MNKTELSLLAKASIKIFLDKWHPELKLRKSIDGEDEIRVEIADEISDVPDMGIAVPTYADVDVFLQPPDKHYGEWQKIIVIPIGEYLCFEEIEARGYFHKSVLRGTTSLDFDDVDQEIIDGVAKDVTVDDATWKLTKKEVQRG